MMGFPPDWTAVDSAVSAMPSSLSSSRFSDELSSSDSPEEAQEPDEVDEEVGSGIVVTEVVEQAPGGDPVAHLAFSWEPPASPPLEVVPPPAAPIVDHRDESQFALFDLREPWREHWEGMPEYTHEDLEPVRSVIVHFLTDQDVEAFERLVEQSLGKTMKSIWYPEAEVGTFADKRYADDNGGAA
jgi:hypothetical protein